MSTKKLQIIGSIGSNVEVDATLEQEGKAADAKAVGDALAEHSHSYNDLNDKPFYKNVTEEIVFSRLVPVESVDSDGDGTYDFRMVVYGSDYSGFFVPVVGETYRVVISGYCDNTCTAQLIDGCVAIGNADISGLQYVDGVGENFLILFDPEVSELSFFFPIAKLSGGTNGGTQVAATEGGIDLPISYTVSVSHVSASIKTIGTEFLSDDVATKEYVQSCLADIPDHTHSWNDLVGKPFYDGEKTVVVETAEILFINDGYAGESGGYPSSIASPAPVRYLDLVEGTSYVVVYDGDEYSARVATNNKGDLFIGGEGGYDCSVTEAQPFYFEMNSDGTMLIRSYTEGSHTVGLYIPGEIKTLDEKYIPDTIARMSDINAGINATIDNTLSVPGRTADAKITGDAIATLNTLVGSKSVSDQISEAITEVYVQNEEPVGAPDDVLWVDLDEASNNGVTSVSNIPVITAEDEDKMIQVVGGKYVLVSISESSIAAYIDNYINEALGGDY